MDDRSSYTDMKYGFFVIELSSTKLRCQSLKLLFCPRFSGSKMIMICSCYELERIHKLSARICSKPLRSLIPKEMKETQVSL